MWKAAASCGFALALLGALSFEAAAQSSCSGWRSTCVSRCKGQGFQNCSRCDEEMSNCRRSGCWRETPQFGGKEHCNLKKS